MNVVVEVISLDNIDVDIDNWSLFVSTGATVDVSWIIFDVVINWPSEEPELVCEDDIISWGMYALVVVSIDIELTSDVKDVNISSLENVERDGVVVTVVCSKVLFKFWLEVIDWVDSLVLSLVCSLVDSLLLNVVISNL